METGSGPETVRRDGVLASWEPSGRGVVPAIVGLVVVANLVGVATVTMLLIGVEDGSGNTGRGPVLWATAAYLAVALPGRHGRRAAAAAGHQPLADGRAGTHRARKRGTRCACRWTPLSSPA